MALFEFTDKEGNVVKMDLTLAKANQLVGEKYVKYRMLHGGTSGHGTPGEDF